MQAANMDVIKEIPGYQIIMKAVLKHQIQQLVEQLADTTGEESILLTASVSDGTLSHLGSESGKNFLQVHDEFKSQFLGYVLKSHHRKKQPEKQFASGPGRKSSTQKSLPLMYDMDSDPVYLEPDINSDSELEIIQEPVETTPRPVSVTRVSGAVKSKEPVSEIKKRPKRSATATKSPYKSNIYLADDENLDDNLSDEDHSNSAINTDEMPAEYTKIVPASDALPLTEMSTSVTEIGTGDQGYAENSGASVEVESGLGEPFIVKMEAESDYETVVVNKEAVVVNKEAGVVNKELKEDPDWQPGAKKRRKSSGSRSVTSPVQSSELKFDCDVCGKTYVSIFNLTRHRQIHEAPQPCHCGATFSTKEGLKEHENAKHKSLYVCKECPVWRQFMSRSGLFSHRNLVHKTTSTFKCEICGRRFGQLGHLKDHMIAHSSEANCVCDLCGKRFKYPYSLRKHLKICTGAVIRRGRPRTKGLVKMKSEEGAAPSEESSTPDPATCHRCGKSFSDQKYLKQHLQKHITDLRICPTCGKPFKFKSSLCRHIKICSKKGAKSSEAHVEQLVQSVGKTVLSGISTGTVLSELSEAIYIVAGDTVSSVDSDVSNAVNTQIGTSLDPRVISLLTTSDSTVDAGVANDQADATSTVVDTDVKVALSASNGSVSAPARSYVDNSVVTVLNATTGSNVNTGVVSVQSAMGSVLSNLSESITELTSPAVVATVSDSGDLVEYTAVLSTPSESTQVESTPSELE